MLTEVKVLFLKPEEEKDKSHFTDKEVNVTIFYVLGLLVSPTVLLRVPCWRIGLIRFPARWHKRPLNQALVSLCLVLLE